MLRNLIGCIDILNATSYDNAFKMYNGSLTIDDCIFERMNLYNGSGGVCFLGTNCLDLYVSYSAFYNCSSLRGGCIYMLSNNNNSTVSIRKCCAIYCSCSTGGNGELGYFGVKKGIILQDLSCSYCGNPTLLGISLISNCFSKDSSIDHLNSSFNMAKSCLFQFSTIGHSQISYCHLINCSVHTGHVFGIYGGLLFEVNYTVFCKFSVETGSLLFLFGSPRVYLKRIVLLNNGGDFTGGSKDFIYIDECVYFNQKINMNIFAQATNLINSFTQLPMYSFFSSKNCIPYIENSVVPRQSIIPYILSGVILVCLLISVKLYYDKTAMNRALLMNESIVIDFG